MDEADEVREMDDFDNDEEQSLSRSMSQMTTRGDATQPDDESHNVIFSSSIKVFFALYILFPLFSFYQG